MCAIALFSKTPNMPEYVSPSFSYPSLDFFIANLDWGHVVPATAPALQASEVCKEEVFWKAGVEGRNKRSEKTAEASHKDKETMPEKPRSGTTLLKRCFVDPRLHYYEESISSRDASTPSSRHSCGFHQVRKFADELRRPHGRSWGR